MLNQLDQTKSSYVVIHTSAQTICNMSEREGPLKFSVLK